MSDPPSAARPSRRSSIRPAPTSSQAPGGGTARPVTLPRSSATAHPRERSSTLVPGDGSLTGLLALALVLDLIRNVVRRFALQLGGRLGRVVDMRVQAREVGQ